MIMALKTTPKYSDVLRWNTRNVSDWLKEIGFEDCVKSFGEKNINGQALLGLQEIHLMTMSGVPVSRRKKILKYVADINKTVNKKSSLFGGKKDKPIPGVPPRDYHAVVTHHEHEEEHDDWGSDEFDDDDGPEEIYDLPADESTPPKSDTHTNNNQSQLIPTMGEDEEDEDDYENPDITLPSKRTTLIEPTAASEESEDDDYVAPVEAPPGSIKIPPKMEPPRRKPLPPPPPEDFDDGPALPPRTSLDPPAKPLRAQPVGVVRPLPAQPSVTEEDDDENYLAPDITIPSPTSSIKATFNQESKLPNRPLPSVPPQSTSVSPHSAKPTKPVPAIPRTIPAVPAPRHTPPVARSPDSPTFNSIDSPPPIPFISNREKNNNMGKTSNPPLPASPTKPDRALPAQPSDDTDLEKNRIDIGQGIQDRLKRFQNGGPQIPTERKGIKPQVTDATRKINKLDIKKMGIALPVPPVPETKKSPLKAADLSSTMSSPKPLKRDLPPPPVPGGEDKRKQNKGLTSPRGLPPVPLDDRPPPPVPGKEPVPKQRQLPSVPADPPVPPVPAGGHKFSPARQLPPVPQGARSPPPIPKSDDKRAVPPVPKPDEPEKDTPANLDRTLYDLGWYHGGISRSVANERLEHMKNNGDFLVRKSNRGDPSAPYTLQLWYQGNIKALNIGRRSNGKFALGSEKLNEEQFDQVPDLISFHLSKHIVLAGGGEVKLKNPIIRH
ncbi:unnamed protein product [Owenia fusiformis]|uniref:Uncharacterized protein n=1 Tax=Owenia fusiformis TaxID=6347 RepID=A0A8J1XG06_OWEFU|nr:unnamed protein product [Owenia fusiformis]